MLLAALDGVPDLDPVLVEDCHEGLENRRGLSWLSCLPWICSAGVVRDRSAVWAVVDAPLDPELVLALLHHFVEGAHDVFGDWHLHRGD